MKKYQIAEVNKEENNAGTKANKDIAAIADKLGYEKVYIHTRNDILNIKGKIERQIRYIADWDKAYKAIEPESLVLLQHPFHLAQLTRDDKLRNLKYKKHCRFISLVHDVEYLRGYRYNDYYKNEFAVMMELADVLIVHNDIMAKYFIEQGFAPEKIVTLEIFDYLQDKATNVEKIFEKSITVAGNLDTQKCGYVGELGEVDPVKVHLYGSNYNNSLDKCPNITYYGSFPPNEIPYKLDRGYGLVWDGAGIDGLSGQSGEYVKYNNPHKLSLYLSSGIPVIIPEEAAESGFVRKYNVGIAVKSLKDLNSILEKVTREEYYKMVRNTTEISEKLISGYFGTAAIKKAESILGI